MSQGVIDRYGIERLLIAGDVVSDGHVVDGMETYYWTTMAIEKVYEIVYGLRSERRPD